MHSSSNGASITQASTRYRYIKLNENGKVDWEGGDNRNVWVVPHVNYTLNDGALEVNLLQLKGFLNLPKTFHHFWDDGSW